MDEVSIDKVAGYWDKVVDGIITYGPGLLMAVVVLYVGLKVIAKVTRVAGVAMEKAGISKNILPFLTSIIGVAMKVMLFFSVAGMVGIDTASFVAVLAAAGFAVGLALQGSLSNFAAGIIVLLFKPYKVGQWIEVSEKFGQVEEIQIFNTIMVTPGKKTLIIPNGQIVDNIVTNYSKKGYIRMELQVTMPYAESFPKVRQIIIDALEPIPGILREPALEVGIESYDSHSIVVGVRPYVKPDDYWEVTFASYENIKNAFHQHGIKVAYSEGVELGPIGG